MVFPFAVPVSLSELPGVVELTVRPNDPVTLPLKFPVKEKDPVSV
jgi:hypothetical protein